MVGAIADKSTCNTENGLQPYSVAHHDLTTTLVFLQPSLFSSQLLFYQCVNNYTKIN